MSHKRNNGYGGGVIAFSVSPVLANTFEFEGNADGAGNRPLELESNSYEDIKILLKGIDGRWDSTDTTEALVISGKEFKEFTATKTVSIVNAVLDPNIDNNGGIYARDSATINFTDMDSVYIAAIDGQEERNDSTAISAKTPYSGGWSGIFNNYTQNNTVNVSEK